MEAPHLQSTEWAESARPSTLLRQRSNSFPIVQALGCSTPEAQLILAEGRAAVRKRRGRRNRSINKETSTLQPRNHLKYLEAAPDPDWAEAEPVSSDARSCHARIPSNTTDRSTSTVVPVLGDSEAHNTGSAPDTLGNYSANLAQFIKAQLKSIPTYQPELDSTSPLSPQSCPDFSFPMRSPTLSPTTSIRRPADAPKVIEIPPVRPPARSAFSAWSSTDDGTDSDAASLPDTERHTKAVGSKRSTYAPSVLGYYETSNSAPFLFSSTPIEDQGEPDTAKASAFPNQAALPGSATEHQDDDDDYPSSCLSRPQLTVSSAPSYSSSSASASASASSYFDCKRTLAITPYMKDRIMAALTPPYPHTKIVSATSPWEGGAIANVHDVFVESQQRVHVDGMTFDMIRDFIVPTRASTPC
ncbi:hypothetical protein CC86DRAFT_285867 [Ophiobolus disseminans]|uniref:Uncharacterized protein n=1 Tax=Ophiobolus disseminans TaxID=1469910 RepID=A0A6A7AA19_9PLEO|nr:hypothetical protein CC86DRAFT_285867 [Ophiobolus disseminans]